MAQALAALGLRDEHGAFVGNPVARDLGDMDCGLRLYLTPAKQDLSLLHLWYGPHTTTAQRRQWVQAWQNWRDQLERA